MGLQREGESLVEIPVELLLVVKIDHPKITNKIVFGFSEKLKI